MIVIVAGVWILGWIDNEPSPNTPRSYRSSTIESPRRFIKLFGKRRSLNTQNPHADEEDVLNDPDLLLHEAEALLANQIVSTPISANGLGIANEGIL